MKVLVIGSGAREHALVRGLAADPAVDQVLVAPGNPGMAAQATLVALSGPVTDGPAVVAAAQEHGVDLVVVGPEAPLVAGVADAVRGAGIDCFGPSAAGARLEGSKAFAKEIMAAAGVPTGAPRVCTTMDQVLDAMEELGEPYVVKEDGLAAGKGVVVTDDAAVASEHASACLAKAGGQVVIEEYLDGPEVSLFCITDGMHVLPLAPAQDFKRVGDDDAGPNTGGMGAYSPLSWVPADLAATIVEQVAQPTIDEMVRRGTPFAGVLYVGLAMTSKGPKVIEFNARFGDPETQVVLARLRTPLGGLLQAAAQGRLAEVGALEWDPRSAVTVVIASENYPGTPRTGDIITGLDEIAQAADADAYVLHAGTALKEGSIVSAGGRVLSVVALGDDLGQARARAYDVVGRIGLRGSHHRTDIAAQAERGEVTIPA